MRALLPILAALLGGCPPPPVVRPYPPPRAEELLAHLSRQGAGLTSLRGRAKADYHEGLTRVRLTIATLAARPDRLRLAAENALAGPLMTLTTDGTDFQLLDIREGRFLAGPAAPCALSHLLRMELGPREVVAALLGGVAAPEPVRAAVSWDGRDGGREVLTLTDTAGRTAELRFDAQGRRWDLREALFRGAGGRPDYHVRHEGFAEHALPGGGTVRLPATTTVEDIPRRKSLLLRWRERELNPSLPEDAFRLTPPEGVPVEPAACGS